MLEHRLERGNVKRKQERKADQGVEGLVTAPLKVLTVTSHLPRGHSSVRRSALPASFRVFHWVFKNQYIF